MDILELFARQGAELSQKEMSVALGIPLPTVHRLTAALDERGYLQRDPQTRRYRLGLALARLMPPLLSGLRLPDVARSHVAWLAAETGETVSLAVRQGGEIVYLVSESGGRLLGTRAAVGMRLPVHCTALGKCLLAQLSDDDARAAAGDEPYERRTPATARTWAELRRGLEEVRRLGVAQSWEEYEAGLASVAVPVGRVDGVGDAALNVSLPTTRATPEFRGELAGHLRAIAQRIEAGLAVHTG